MEKGKCSKIQFYEFRLTEDDDDCFVIRMATVVTPKSGVCLLKLVFLLIGTDTHMTEEDTHYNYITIIIIYIWMCGNPLRGEAARIFHVFITIFDGFQNVLIWRLA